MSATRGSALGADDEADESEAVDGTTLADAGGDDRDGRATFYHVPLLRLAMSEIDMRIFAQNAGVNITFAPGSVIFNQDDPGNCMYVVQSGVIEMLIEDKVVEVCSANEAIGFMSVIDQSPRPATARAKESVQLSVIDQRTFKFMVDEVPNFTMYVMGAMARCIRGMSRAI
jgi:CRP/FNR family transcriptional regulator, cyclic AMP receptor protein